jgi:Fur family ferric uptake transcriptional regulator
MNFGWGRRRPRLRKHEQLRRQLQELLEATGSEPDADERVVIEHFLRGEGHLTVEELAEETVRHRPGADAGCVRGVLRTLEKLGIAKPVRTGEAEYWEHLHPGEHHDHLVCVRCGRIVEFLDQGIEARQLEQASLAGFRPLFHRLQIHGICAKCLAERGPVAALSEMAVGERGTVESLGGGRGARRRLEEMGLVPGTAIEVLSSLGLKLVLVRGSRVAIGRGLAAKVLVRRAAP